MKAAPLSLVAFFAASAAAIDIGSHSGVSNVHARLHVAHAKMRRESAGKGYKRCKPKVNVNAPAAPAASNPAPAAPESAPAAPAPAPAPANNNDNTPKTNNYNNNNSGSGGVINVKSDCGDIGATPETTKSSGPNGSEAWLNCGIESGGWRPPYIHINDLKYKDLSADLNSGNSIFEACRPYLDIIYDAAGQTGLQPIMIASIMMQESSCKKDTVGGGGEQGLMQITHDKCGDAPNGDCKEPWFNIHTGAKYLANQINGNDGNVLVGLATYNGWRVGLTYDQATAARYTSCCTCQNNLDYPHQFLNGWMQGINAYSSDLGTYKNLAVCYN